MKKPRFVLSKIFSLQTIGTALILTATLGLLLFGKADILLPGYSTDEVATANASVSLSDIATTPVYAPYKLLVYLFSFATENPLLATRLASGFVGLLTIGLFYYGVRQWHSSRIAFLSTILFGSSGWFLYTARHGAPDIMLPFTVLLFTAAGFWFARENHSRIGYFTVVAALGLSIYVPGVLWVLMVGLFIRRTKDFRTIARELSWWQIMMLICLLIITITPAVYASIKDPGGIVQLLGLPNVVPNVIDFLKNLAFIPLSIVAFSGAEAGFWIGRLPLLDVFSVVLLLLGLYYHFKYRKLDRAQLLLAFGFVVSVIIALNGPVSIALLLPAIYVLIAGGLVLLLAQWETVFPNNPLAKSFGIILLAIAVSASVAYNMRAYFVAWPNTKETRDGFSRQADDLIQ